MRREGRAATGRLMSDANPTPLLGVPTRSQRFVDRINVVGERMERGEFERERMREKAREREKERERKGE